MIVLDTHALLWWSLDPQYLSRKAAAMCEQLESDGGFASAISIWELAVKVRAKKLELPITVGELALQIERNGRLQLVPTDAAIWHRAAELDWEHRDSADRVMVATAQLRGLPILTKVSAMHSQKLVECVW